MERRTPAAASEVEDDLAMNGSALRPCSIDRLHCRVFLAHGEGGLAVGVEQLVYEKEVSPCGEQLNCLLFCR